MQTQPRPHRMSRAGLVLCGGRSTRMGRPKALLPWRGHSLVESVADALRPVVDELVIVTSGEFELPDLGARVVIDREPARGPLGGIRDGLHAIDSDLAFAVGTDSPHLSTAFAEAMFSFGRSAACETDGFVQTLGAVYERSAAGMADALLKKGRARPLFLLRDSGYRTVRPDEVPDADCLRGFNSPDEYLAALRDRDPGPTAILELYGRARLRSSRAHIELPVGTLGEILRGALPEVEICPGGEIAPQYLVSLNAREILRDPRVPIGPGERVIVMDAAVGG